MARFGKHTDIPNITDIQYVMTELLMLKAWVFYVSLESFGELFFFSNLAAEICPHLAAGSFVKSQTDEFVRMNPFYLNLALIHVDVSLLKQEGALFKPSEADYHLNITAYCSI